MNNIVPGIPVEEAGPSTQPSPAAAGEGTGAKRTWLGLLGPGLIVGASDDDPSGIATYSQAGAGYGAGLLWTMLFTYPLVAAVQEISGRIGRVTGRGIAGNIRKFYSPWLLYPLVVMLVTANVFNIGADIGAMGEALKLIVGGNALVYSVGFAALCVVLQVYVSYPKYRRYLKWLTPVLFSYVATVLAVHVNWSEALRGTFIPKLGKTGDYWATFIALLGTTISPYLFFWQASQETEDIRDKTEDEPLKNAPQQAPEQLSRIRFDTYVGMFLSNVIAYFIILAAAATLHRHGITTIDTAAQAADALRPIAGRFASTIFALGIVGTGLLAVPVLAGSAAYASAEALQWQSGMGKKPRAAKGFYGVLAVATLIGLAMNFPVVQSHTHLTPIRALFWSAVLNGVAASPVMLMMMLINSNPKAMGKFSGISPWMRFFGWTATVVMAGAVVGLFWTWNS